jgi:type II secretory pathway pseudopilin PulG
MRRASEEQGFVLVAAIILLTVMMGLGLGLLLLTDGQQKASASEQASESAFNVAEAALNAQVGQVSRSWPGTIKFQENEIYPKTGCTAASSTAANGCPTAESLKIGYPSSSTTCPAGSPKDAWASTTTNPPPEWTTYVREPESVANTYFNSTVEKNLANWDEHSYEKLWVRAVGVVQCRMVVLVTQVARQQITLNFPKDAATGNWFKVTNKGNKVIVNTAGEPPVGETGPVSMRCSGLTEAECKQWSKEKEQISPDTTGVPPTPSPLLNEAQTEALKAQAQAAGTFHSAALGNCPGSLEEMSGLPAYVEGCGNLKMTGGEGNSVANPGFLVLAEGTLELKGNAEFHGVIYARNPSNLSGPVVTLGGTAQVFGAIDVDGNGGIEFGSSKANLIYEPKAIVNLKAYAGATPTRNTFRVLPVNQ